MSDDSNKNNLIVVGVGASAGGLEALQDLIKKLPENDHVVYIIAQHMSPTHKSMMVDLLQKNSGLTVKEATNGAELKGGIIFTTPPNKNIFVEEDRILLKTPSADSILPKPSIDLLFNSMAHSHAKNAIGIILSGTGSDGSMGMKSIKAEGGITFVQDPQSAKYDSMPLASINDHTVDIISEPAGMGVELADVYSFLDGTSDIKPTQAPQSDLMMILGLLKQNTGVDFSNYKTNTINRRIQRRMLALRLNKIPDYVKHLQEDIEESRFLYKDLLIGVTSFFRDADAFEKLKIELAQRFKNKEDIIRIWVVGCSTGEEAYSIAMLIDELFEGQCENVNIFATDLDEDAISIARAGTYSASSVENLSNLRIQTYFNQEKETYQVKKRIRNMVVFSVHDVTRDPPFSKIDLVLCRNLLIYFNNQLQMKVLNALTFALRNEGLLFLGSSESLGDFEGNYKTLSRENKIFKKTFTTNPLDTTLNWTRQLTNIKGKYQLQKKPANNELSLHEVLLDSLSEYFLPLSVLVNESLNVVYSREKNPYLTLPAGTSTLQILKMVPSELELDLRTAIHKANREEAPQVTRYIKTRLKADGAFCWGRMIIIPIAAKYQKSQLMVISFQDENPEMLQIDTLDQPVDDKSPYARQLESELNKTKAQLQAVIEELETSNEELQATNEELQSSNEELQSTNEELETTNEELQSTNEEVQVAYNELKVVSEETERQRNIAQSALHELEIEKSLLQGVSDSSTSGVMAFQAVRDDNFEIIDFKWILINKEAEKIISRKTDDLLGKKLLEEMPGNKTEGLFDIYKNVTMTRETVQREFYYNHEGLDHWFYQTIVAYLDGFVVSFTDITEKKQKDELLRLHEERLRQATEAAEIGVWELELSTSILTCNPIMFEQFGFPVTSKKINLQDWKAMIHPDDQHSFSKMLDKSLQSSDGFDVVYKSRTQPVRHFHAQAKTLNGADNQPSRVIGINFDITDQFFYQETLKDLKNRALASNREKSQFIASLSHEFRTPMHAILSFSKLGEKCVSIEKSHHFFGNIHASAERLGSLINNLLDFSKLESGKMQGNPEITNIVEITQQSIDEIASLLLEKNLNVVIEEKRKIFANVDIALMKQVFVNLLSNAIKFSSEGDVIRISFDIVNNPSKLTNKSKKLAIISVIDQGVGIPEAELESIFGLFSQSSHTQKTYKGTGLGLPISREIIHLFDGKIWAESPPSGQLVGTAMIIQLPLVEN